MKKITIHINQKPYHFETSELTPQDFRDAIGAPSDYEVWLIIKSPDPEGQLPKDDVQITSPVLIENGQRYRRGASWNIWVIGYGNGNITSRS